MSALQKAQSVAHEYGNQELKQVHLAYALLADQEGLIAQLLTAMGKDVVAVKTALLEQIEKLPKVSGGEQYVGRSLADVLEVAEKLCDKVAVIKGGKLIKAGTMDEVKGDSSLESTFLELV